MCKAPMARLETFTRYTNKKGGISFKPIFTSWADVERNPRFYKAKYRKVDQIGCGTCWECRLQKARNKANQMMLETKLYPENECWFITLTYNDENLHTARIKNESTGEEKEGVSLIVKDAQDFIKRLRRHYEYHYNVKGIRYVLAGEYGSIAKTHRPHYHMIAYGLPLDESKLKKKKTNELGQAVWEHEEIEKIWGLGNITVGRVSWDTCCYVARYTMEKQYGKNSWIYAERGQKPEFVIQSTKPPIGRGYLEKNKENLYITDSITIPKGNGIMKAKPPKSFDNYMEQIDPELMHKIKLKRKAEMEIKQRHLNQLTDLEPWEQRINKCNNLEKKIKNLKREL